jgi:hypothetical protein
VARVGQVRPLLLARPAMIPHSRPARLWRLRTPRAPTARHTVRRGATGAARPRRRGDRVTDRLLRCMSLVLALRDSSLQCQARSVLDGLCCKSPKLLGDNFPAIRRSDRRPTIFVDSITLPRSPVSLSSGDEVPHIFTRKSRLQPGKILITSAKRLLQQNRMQSGHPAD